MGKKAGLLPKNGGAIAKEKEPERPKELRFRKAEGGFIISRSGGEHGWEGKDHVCKDASEVADHLDWLLGKEKAKK